MRVPHKIHWEERPTAVCLLTVPAVAMIAIVGGNFLESCAWVQREAGALFDSSACRELAWHQTGYFKNGRISACSPSPIREALIAIAELAAPENQSRLEDAVFHAPLALGLDPQSPPIRLAVHLWLWRPYQFDCRSRREEADPEPHDQSAQTANDITP